MFVLPSSWVIWRRCFLSKKIIWTLSRFYWSLKKIQEIVDFFLDFTQMVWNFLKVNFFLESYCNKKSVVLKTTSLGNRLSTLGKRVLGKKIWKSCASLTQYFFHFVKKSEIFSCSSSFFTNFFVTDKNKNYTFSFIYRI